MPVAYVHEADGRLLSWSYDKTLRLWDSQSGAPLAVLEGHTWAVKGAQELSDGRLLSWSGDKTLRLWDSQNGACLAVLEGHTGAVWGAQELSDGRLLSWSGADKTLRLWDSQSGACLAVLEDGVHGAQELSDGRLLSWSSDNTLRLWDSQSGACLTVLEGHTGWVWGVLELADGRLLSWSWDKTLRLWDSQSGACLEVVPYEQVAGRHPEWLQIVVKADEPESVSDDFFVDDSYRWAELRYKETAPPLAMWIADSETQPKCLVPDGTAVVTQYSGQVCILKLYHGNRRISLAECEALLPQLYPDQQIQPDGP